jgi:alpha-tubulin suppressor-like RCC1 family protein
VVTGAFHTCAETTTSRAYCWGSNGNSALGDGTTETRYAPVPVAGGLLFAQVHAGGFHTCARTSGNVAYCWGRGLNGQLGNGSTTVQSTPVAVAGTM